jgi:hypothetical protein
MSMARTLRLPRADHTLIEYTVRDQRQFEVVAGPLRSRTAFAAVHVVADPLATKNPTLDATIDWDLTLAYRRYLWSLGLAVAEAMDTAQRGMGLNWAAAQELIRRSIAEARAVGGRVACGASTDHLTPGLNVTIAQVEAAYEEQCSFVEGLGGQVILMASRALAAAARSSDDYVRVYSRILSQVERPVILHWLGDMFDPALAGYWGSRDIDQAMDVCLQIIAEHATNCTLHLHGYHRRPPMGCGMGPKVQ